MKHSLVESLFNKTGGLEAQVFSCEVYDIFKNSFSNGTPLVTTDAPAVAASVFSKKVLLKETRHLLKK